MPDNRITLFDVVAFVLSQVPSGTIVLGYTQLSLYQPAFYRGQELFLVIPALVGLFATWIVMRDHRAMYWIFVGGLLLGMINFAIFEFVDLQNVAHTVNWILSYCTFALIVAAAMRFVGELIGLKKIS